MTKRLFPLSALALLMITGTALADDWSTVLAAADTDSNGAIDKMEVMNFNDPLGAPGFAPFFAAHFSEMDSNSDGMVSMDEMKAAMASMKLSDEMLTAMFNRDIYEKL